MATSVREWSPGVAPPPGYKLVRETYPLAPKRDLILAQLQDILSRNVQKLVVQVNTPIEVLRLVKADEIDTSMEEVNVDDLYKQARNAEMIEFPPRGIGSTKMLFFAFRTLERKDMVPIAILVSSISRLKEWLDLEVDDEIETVFNVKVMVHGEDEIPDEALLLVAGFKEDPTTVALSLRMEMDLPKEG